MTPSSYSHRSLISMRLYDPGRADTWPFPRGVQVPYRVQVIAQITWLSFAFSSYYLATVRSWALTALGFLV